MKIPKVLWFKFFAILLLAVTTPVLQANAQDRGMAPPPPPPGANEQTATSQQPSGDADADQDADPAKIADTQPSVGRLSLVRGDVSTQRGDAPEWSPVTLNTPLSRGDQIATGNKSQTEVQLDFANVLRLSERSQVKIADLTRNHIQLQVSQGWTSFSILKGSEADVEIDSPNVAVHPLGPGRYRVQVISDSETEVIVREGEAEVSTPQGSTKLHAGELITIRGTDNPEYKISSAPGTDDWDHFNKDRDRLIVTADGVQKTNQYYTGAQDLDAYGSWVDAPGYGQVWSPRNVDADWAPYQTGRWVWQGYYGWTWVSYEPWGWAPYHYGRWFVHRGAWCWWPGPVYVGYRPLWAPAYVTFFGFGHHHGGFGFGSVGWLAIGPFDPFYRWYGRGFGRVGVVAFGGFNFREHHGFVAPLGIHGRQPFVSNTGLALTNARVRSGINSVPAGDFGRGVMTGRRSGIDEGALRESHVMTGNVGIVPTHESLRSTPGGVAVRSTSVQPRNTDHFFVKNQPPSGPPTFHDQAARVQQVVQGRGTESSAGGKTGAGFSGGPTSGSGGAQASGGARTTGGPVSGSAGGQTSGGARISGGPASGNGGPQTSGGNGQPSNNGDGRTGWHSFGSGSGNGNGQGQGQQGQGQQGQGQGGNHSAKPPLELSKPIVQPRPSDTRATTSTTSTPRYTPPTNQPRYTPPAPSRTPPSHSGSSSGGSHGGGSHSGGSSGHSGGSSGHSSGSSSHSSSSHSSSKK